MNFNECDFFAYMNNRYTKININNVFHVFGDGYCIILDLYKYKSMGYIKNITRNFSYGTTFKLTDSGKRVVQTVLDYKAL